LTYYGVNFNDKKYTDPNEWFGKDKTGLGISFPNLPYLIDGDIKISESTAINQYIVGKWGNGDLIGKSAECRGKI